MVIYKAEMDTWTHSQDYPVSKIFYTKASASKYIKRALKIYPYAKITLYKYPKTGKAIKVGTYKWGK